MIRGSAFGIVLLAAMLGARAAWCEVSTDGSFGPAQALAPVGNEYLIPQELGGRNGGNLFHSFSLFGVEAGRTANFSATLPTERVIARVTGGTRSQIDGRLRTSGSAAGADLFLLNPSGVTFGPTASLDLRGSFYVSTAQELRFESGPAFDATSSAPKPPLSIAAPSAFGFLTDSPERIRFNQTAGLALPAGETFSIIGGAASLTGFNRPAIRVPSGRIQIAAVDRASEVPIDLAGFSGQALAAAVTVDEIPDVTLEQGFFLDVGGDPAAEGPAGQVLIRGGSLVFSGSRIDAGHRSAQDATAPAIDIEMVNGVDLREASRLTSQDTGSGRGPDISIKAPKLSVHGSNTIVQTQSLGAGAGGTLSLSGDSIEISDNGIVRSLAAGSGAGGALVLEAMQGVRVVSGGSLFTSTTGAGEGGAAAVSAATLEVADGGFIVSEAGGEGGTGAGGDLVIHADRVFVSNATNRAIPASIATLALGSTPGGSLRLLTTSLEIERGGSASTRTDGAGQGGTLQVVADRVALAGVDAQGRRASLRAFTVPGSSGPGGSLAVTARTVEVADGGQMSTLTQGAGDAGSLSVDAAEAFTVSGSASGASIVSADSRRVIGGPTPVPGGGGDLTIRTGLLTLNDGGQVSASTEGTRDSGKIRIEAGKVVVSGVDPAFGNASGVFSRSNADLEDGGDARGIEIVTTGNVQISDRGVLSSSTVASGNAGPIRVEAGGQIGLGTKATISARAEGPFTGNGGSVDLIADEGVFLSSSSILAESQGFGLAGDVTIDAGPRFEMNDSTVKTEARFGAGGRITIVADQIVYLQSSELTTSVAKGAGGGGDISIDPDVVVLNQSEIHANAGGIGEGGHISITAGAFFMTPDSEITATSELGIDGTILINAPDTDVTSGITTLPSDVLDATALMRSACSAATAEGGSFVVSGRPPGLPIHPDGLLAAFDTIGGAAAIARPGTVIPAATSVASAYRTGSCSRAREEVL